MKKFFTIFILMILSNCSNNKLEQAAKPKIEIEKFWLNFQDPNLHKLVEEALTANSDVLTAMHNVNRAQAELGISNSKRLPNVAVSGNVARSRDSDKMNSTFVHSTYNSFSLAAVLSYQIDLWGRMAAATKAKQAELASLKETKKIVQLTIASEVMKSYFQIIGLKNKLDRFEEMLQDAEQIYQLTLKQFHLGFCDQNMLELANIDLQNSKSQFLSVKNDLFKTEKALSSLLARDVENSRIIHEDSFSKIKLASIPSEISSKLLMKRPDVIAALEMINSSKHAVKHAKAAYFPEISLTTMLGKSANYLSDISSSDAKMRSTSIGVNLPIFNWGKVGDNVDIAKINKAKAQLQYEQIIRNAFVEGLTAIETLRNNSQGFASARAMLASARKNYKFTSKRLEIGAIDKIAYLKTRQHYLSSEVSYENNALLFYNSNVDLYKAFAGNLK